MSAETLRRAASLMRERAEAVGEGPWESYSLPDAGPDRWTMTGVGVVGDEMGHRVEAMFRPDAEHIASWHPAVALVVADWLETAGADLWAHGPLCECGSGCHDCDDSLWQPHVRRALAVARAYLGEVPDA